MARHNSLSLIAAGCAVLVAACASVQGVRSQPLDAGDVHFYAAPFSDVVAAARTTVLALEINIQDTATVDSTTWMVLGTKGLSLMSYGEVVRVIVHQTADGPVAVRVVSKRRLATNILARNWTDSIFEKLDAIFHPQPQS
jgi:hypothetical protein